MTNERKPKPKPKLEDLELSRETVVDLTEAEAAQVAGGGGSRAAKAPDALNAKEGLAANALGRPAVMVC
jgi:hypothetical protein